MKLTYLSLFVSIIAVGFSCKAQTTIKSTDPHLHYMGRTWTDNGATVLSWPGNLVDINFKGSGIKFTLKDQAGLNYFTEVLDGKVIGVYYPGDTATRTVSINGLSNSEHNLQLFKRTEWAFGKAWFYGFSLDAGAKVLPASLPHKRKIEFYGNSITCGYADIDSTGQDRGMAPYEDGYNSYAPLVARHYNAEFSSISKSGIGVMVSWFPLIAPEMYDRMDATDASIKWDFSKYTPDVVVINLFQNDSWLVNLPTHEQFIARFGGKPPTPQFIINAYASFVKSIRAKYPKAQIVCILGSMDANKEGSPWPGYIQSAVNSLHDSRIYAHPIPYKGTQGHPSLKDQQAMADDLIGFMDKNVTW